MMIMIIVMILLCLFVTLEKGAFTSAVKIVVLFHRYLNGYHVAEMTSSRLRGTFETRCSCELTLPT